MKIAYLAFTAAVAAGGSALAQSAMPMPNVQPLSGYAEAFGGYGWRGDNFGAPSGFNGGGGAARLSYMFMPPLSIQGDVFGNWFDTTGASYDYGDLGGAVHLSARGPNHLIGVFGGYDKVTASPGSGFNTFFYGAEGQAHLGNFTLYGQIGALAGVQADPGYVAPDYIFARMVGRYFFTPNTKLEGGVTLFNGHPYSSIPALADTTTVWNLRLEHKFNGPVSAFVSADTMNSTHVAFLGYSMPYSRVMAGVKLSFGADTLQDANTGGATLDTADFAPLGFVRNNQH